MKIQDMKLVLTKIPLDLIKQEILRRREVESAKKHVDSATRALQKAKTKLERYHRILQEDEAARGSKA